MAVDQETQDIENSQTPETVEVEETSSTQTETVSAPEQPDQSSAQEPLQQEPVASPGEPEPSAGPGLGELVQELAAEQSTPSAPASIEMLSDVELTVKIELGRTKMFVEDVLNLTDGSVVELDKLAGDPVDVYVNERLVARGEVLVLNDNFCVRVSQIVVDQI